MQREEGVYGYLKQDDTATMNPVSSTQFAFLTGEREELRTAISKVIFVHIQ